MRSHLHTLCQQIGLPISESSEGALFFEVDENLLLALRMEDDEQLLITCEIAILEAAQKASASYEIAVGNYLFLQTDGSTLGLDDQSGKVVLARREGLADMDSAQFTVILTRFLDCAEVWSKRFSAENQETSEKKPIPMLLPKLLA